MVILFDIFNLPKNIFEIIFATKQQKIVGELLIGLMKEKGGEIQLDKKARKVVERKKE